MIKTYPAHKGVTNQVHKLKKDDELIIREAFGAIAYQQEGMFIAGGAGITPFISIFRDLKSKNKVGDNQLIFANKTKADIILEQELKELLGSGFINILSDEEEIGYANGFITEKFINLHTRDLKKAFYLCGPPPMVSDIVKQLTNLGVSEKSIIKEEF
jgi:ferredoxin-NADP reductase